MKHVVCAVLVMCATLASPGNPGQAAGAQAVTIQYWHINAPTFGGETVKYGNFPGFRES